MFLNHFDALMSKIKLKNKKNIILIYFQIKNTLKNNFYRNLKLFFWIFLNCLNVVILKIKKYNFNIFT